MNNLKELEKEKRILKLQIKANKYKISDLEKKIRNLKKQNTKKETRIAEINGEQIKILNNNRELPIFIGKPRGMI